MFRKSLLKILLQKLIMLFIQSLICVLLNGGLLLIRFVINKEIQWLLFSVVVACLYSPMIQEKSTHHQSVLMQRAVVQHNSNHSIMSMFNGSTTFNVSAKTKRLVTEALAKMCAKDIRPFEIVAGSE